VGKCGKETVSRKRGYNRTSRGLAENETDTLLRQIGDLLSQINEKTLVKTRARILKKYRSYGSAKDKRLQK